MNVAFCVPQPCHCDILSCCTQGMCIYRSFGEHTSHARSQTQAHNSLWCRLLHLPPLYANYPCGETDFSENLWRRWGTSGRPSRPHLWQQLHQVLHRQPQRPKAGVEINFLKVEYDSSSTVFQNLVSSSNTAVLDPDLGICREVKFGFQHDQNIS